MLPMAENAYNKSVTSTIAMSLFYANYGYYPRTNSHTEAEARNGWSQNYMNWISSVHSSVKRTCRRHVTEWIDTGTGVRKNLRIMKQRTL
jgi:hypothetical protein